jgi:hypothetical protein
VRVTAQGYSEAEQQFALDRGLTEADITLARQPFSLLPSQACAPDETLLYAEDFQDGAVENWGTVPPGTTVPIEVDPLAAENKVLLLNFGGTDGEFQVNPIPFQDNVVRRLKYMPGDHSRFSVGWGEGGSTGEFFIVLSSDGILLNYFVKDAGVKTLSHGKPAMAQNVWHLLEISSINGKIEVWADGKLAASAEEAPATEGTFLTMGSAFLPLESIVRIDDVSVCGLSAPFTSIYSPAP